MLSCWPEPRYETRAGFPPPEFHSPCFDSTDGFLYVSSFPSDTQTASGGKRKGGTREARATGAGQTKGGIGSASAAGSLSAQTGGGAAEGGGGEAASAGTPT